jgi:hypothetical protein
VGGRSDAYVWAALTRASNQAFTCFYTLFAFVTILTVCRPIAGQWDASLRPKCYSRLIYRDFGLFNAG